MSLYINVILTSFLTSSSKLFFTQMSFIIIFSFPVSLSQKSFVCLFLFKLHKFLVDFQTDEGDFNILFLCLTNFSSDLF